MPSRISPIARAFTKRLYFERLEPRRCLAANVFVPQTVACCSINPSATLVTDVDGDQRPDIVSASHWTNRIVWYRNEGQRIDAERVIAEGESYIDLKAGDIDGDGDIDLASVTDGTPKLVWYENLDESGHFRERPIATLATFGLATIWLADLDGDVDIDLLAATSRGNNFIWLENVDGRGDYVKKQETAVPEGVRSILATDVDGDGDHDVLATLANSGQIVSYPNLDGQGTFGAARTTYGAASASSLQLADIDQDGDDDILAGVGNAVVWLEMTGRNGLSQEPKVLAELEGLVSGLYLGDLDADGDMDLVSGEFRLSDGRNQLYWLENENGAFGPPRLISRHGGHGNSVVVADFNRDGAQDLMLASTDLDSSVGRSESFIAWFENDSQRGFRMRQITTNPIDRNTVQVADIDGDGDRDIITTSFFYSRGTIDWYENLDGRSRFNNRRQVVVTQQGISSAQAFDMDQDGDLDILFAVERDRRVAWVENLDGRASFGPAQPIAHGIGRPRIVVALDADNDDDTDILVASVAPRSFALLLRHSDGYDVQDLSPEFHFPAYRQRSFQVADLDSDGDWDILLASPNDDLVSWFENQDGQGNGIYRIIAVIDKPIWSEAGDIDGDGDLDVAVATEHGEIAWYENRADAAFGPANVVASAGVESNRVARLLDADGDNDLDIAVASAHRFDGNARLEWFENVDSRGTFQTGRLISMSNDRSVWIDVADVDADGDADILHATGFDERVTWYEYRLIGDVDDDGDFDSTDLVTVFKAGKYEDDIPNNATFDEGDWNGDGDFDTRDLVFAFQAGHYAAAVKPLESRLAAAVDWMFARGDTAYKSRAFVA